MVISSLGSGTLRKPHAFIRMVGRLSCMFCIRSFIGRCYISLVMSSSCTCCIAISTTWLVCILHRDFFYNLYRYLFNETFFWCSKACVSKVILKAVLFLCFCGFFLRPSFIFSFSILCITKIIIINNWLVRLFYFYNI